MADRVRLYGGYAPAYYGGYAPAYYGYAPAYTTPPTMVRDIDALFAPHTHTTALGTIAGIVTVGDRQGATLSRDNEGRRDVGCRRFPRTMLFVTAFLSGLFGGRRYRGPLVRPASRLTPPGRSSTPRPRPTQRPACGAGAIPQNPHDLWLGTAKNTTSCAELSYTSR